MRTLYLIGVGPGNPTFMTKQAIAAVNASDILLGGERALKTVQDACSLNEEAYCTALKTETVSGWKAMYDFVLSHPEYGTLALAFTGDTSVYSAAIPLRKALEECETESFRIINVPGVSSIQYFLSRSGISMADVKLVSLHGRSINMVPLIRENHYVCALLEEEEDVAEIAERLAQFGLHQVEITVGERLSYEEECFTTGSPKEIRRQRFDPMAIALFTNEDFRIPTRSYGIADERFQGSGGIPTTRRDVRALSLCRLAIHENSVIYDINAGNGSVSIEAALNCPEGQVISVVSSEDDAMAVERNRYAFRIDNLRVIEGEAPACFSEYRVETAARTHGGRGTVVSAKDREPEVLPKPDCVFVNGSKGNLLEMVQWAITANPEVIVVVNTVTLEGVMEVLEIERKLTDYKFEMVEIQSTGLERRGSYHTHQAENPVTITRISRR